MLVWPLMGATDRPGAVAARAASPPSIADAGGPDLLAAFRRSREPQVLEALVKLHLPLVRRIASAHSDRNDSEALDDLCQVGAIGLLRAIDRFDPGLGRPFEAYAGACIAGEMRHFLRDLGQIVRVPRELQELRPQVIRATARLSQGLHRAPRAEEIAAEIGATADKVAEVLELIEAGGTVSLDDESGAEPGKALKHHLVDKRYRSFQLATEDRIMLGQAVARLKDVSREVIEFAFYEDLTQTEIAKKLGISQMQVSRRVRAALGELWKLLNSPLWG